MTPLAAATPSARKVLTVGAALIAWGADLPANRLVTSRAANREVQRDEALEREHNPALRTYQRRRGKAPVRIESRMSHGRCQPGQTNASRLLRARLHAAIVFALATLFVPSHAQQQAPRQNPDVGIHFMSGVEFINVTAVVSDTAGRFFSGPLKDDFLVYEDDQPQVVTLFSAERVPLSLGIALDTSGSMVGERIRAAQDALDSLLSHTLYGQDEVFLYRFSDRPVLVQGWTTDRRVLTQALGRIVATGGTSLYDTVTAAVRLAATGQYRKKALVVLSDGKDTTSRMKLRDVKELIRECDALVYAVAIDCGPESRRPSSERPRFQRRGPLPIPLPFPPNGRSGWPAPPQPIPPQPQNRSTRVGCTDPIDVTALRDLTDDSGGRTEIVRGPEDLNPATLAIADELSKQYHLGYVSTGSKDGRWHSIRVELRQGDYRIRARRGYVAS
jgi:VWFA-related protein